jgi:hypothetical protein
VAAVPAQRTEPTVIDVRSIVGRICQDFPRAHPDDVKSDVALWCHALRPAFDTDVALMREVESEVRAGLRPTGS